MASRINKRNLSREPSRGTENEPTSLGNDQGDEEDLDLQGVDLLYQMDIEDIIGLRLHFFPEPDNKEWLKANPQGLSLNRTQFIEAMDALAGGSSVLSLCAGQLFDTLDIDNSGLLQWEEVLDAIIEKTGGSPDERYGWIPINPEVNIRTVPHCRGEIVLKVIPLETETTFCYAIISKLGRVGVYDGELNPLDSYRLGMKPTEEATRDFNEFDSDEVKVKQYRRSSTTFLTDAIFIPDSYALLFASSDRSLHLYDATGLVHVPLCHLMGLPDGPTCLDYQSNKESNKPSLLFIGDDHGNVTIMKFHQPRNSLFKKKHPDKLDKFYWTELEAQADYVTYTVNRDVHNDVIKQITFCPDNDTVLTCSNDPHRTVMIRHIEDRREPYLFKLPRGVRCFHQDRFLHILVTGSSDNLVRIWNPVVTQRPVASLYGHESPVEDVRIIRVLKVILSLETAGILKVWDVLDECCIQTIALAFPCLEIQGKKIEYGARSIFPGPSKLTDGKDEIRRSSKELPHPAARTSISGSNVEDAVTQMSALDFRLNEEEWQRDSVVVVCCNYAAILNLNLPQTALSKTEEPINPTTILPPPTKDLYASGAKTFKASNGNQSPKGSEGSKGTSDSSLDSLTQKDGSSIQKTKTPNAAQLRMKQEQKRMLIAQGAPHLALDLYDMKPITFSMELPITKRMREEGILVTEPEVLMRARLVRESTLTAKGDSLDGSGPRESKNMYNSQTIRGRPTPEWFHSNLESDPLHYEESL